VVAGQVACAGARCAVKCHAREELVAPERPGNKVCCLAVRPCEPMSQVAILIFTCSSSTNLDRACHVQPECRPQSRPARARRRYRRAALWRA